jgi:XTP/dITP diphosphohydrolase
VPTGQPALALAQKVIQRANEAGLPADLIPAAITSITVTADVDAENALRTAALEFMDTVRSTEKAIAAERRGENVPEEFDVAPLGVIAEEEWRAYWPPAVRETVAEEEVAEDEDGEPEADAPADAAVAAEESPAQPAPGSSGEPSGEEELVESTLVEPVSEAPADGQDSQLSKVEPE